MLVCRARLQNQSQPLDKKIPFLFATDLYVRLPSRSKPILAVSSIGVDKGKCLFILGENGAGKTTLLSVLAGFLVPDSGQILLNGKRIKPLSERLVPGFEGIERVEQSPQANPFLTVSENLEKSLRSLPEREEKRQSKYLVALCHLKKLLDQKTGSLSGGELRRLSLALSLASNPAVLLLDEPFAELDAQTRMEFLQILLNLKNSGNCALIVVSHQAQEAQWLADEIRVLKNGKWAETIQKSGGKFVPQTILSARLLGYSNLLFVSNAHLNVPLGEVNQSSWIHIPPFSIHFHALAAGVELGEFQLLQSYCEGEFWHSLWRKEQIVLRVSGKEMPEKEPSLLFADPHQIIRFRSS